MKAVSFVMYSETMWHMASRVPEEFGNWADMSVYKVINSFNYAISFLPLELFLGIGVPWTVGSEAFESTKDQPSC
jgi:hypothetical protein